VPVLRANRENCSLREKAKGGETMQRLLTVLVVALVMAAMVVIMAAPAFADNPHAGGSGKCPPGNVQGCGASPLK
jgi:hypothetical protein